MGTPYTSTIRSFGAMLRFLRQRARMTQRELAARVGYSEAHINRFEKGVRLPAHDVVAARFVTALGLAHDSAEAIRLLVLATPASTITTAATSRPSRRASSVPPHVSTRLIGRDLDIDAAHALIALPETQLLTLVGPPGVGKTRLSLALAGALSEEFSDGSVFVPLAGVDEDSRIPDAILQAMGIVSTDRNPLSQLLSALQDSSYLLVLDNFEQLLHGSSAEGAAIAIAILISAARQNESKLGSKFIITSREPLRITNERVYEVLPLAPSASRELFLSRAQAVNPGFHLEERDSAIVDRICTALDHLPLTIELAAARTRVYSVPTLLHRLADPLAVLTTGSHDLPLRQRTLRNAIDWSYQLLEPEEQALFRRASVYAEGFTLSMLEEIAAKGLITPCADLVQSLVEKNLLRATSTDGQVRFSLLETMREYAGEALAAALEVDVFQQRHGQWFVDHVENAQSSPLKTDDLAWYAWYHSEWPNLRSVIQRSIHGEDPKPGLRLAACLGWTWQMHGPVNDGAHLVAQLLENPASARYRYLCARVRLSGSPPAKGLGQTERSRQYLTDSLAVFRDTGDRLHASWALSSLAVHACNRADYDFAETLLAESTALSRQIGDDMGLAWALLWSGWIERVRGDFAQALKTYASLAKLIQEIDSGMMSYVVPTWTAWVHQDMGDYARAGTICECAHASCLAYGLHSSALVVQSSLGSNALYQGEIAAAVKQLTSATEGLRRHGQFELRMGALPDLGFALHLAGNTVGGMAQLWESLRYGQMKGHTNIIAGCLRALAWVAADTHDLPRAVWLMGAVAACNARSNIQVPAYATQFQTPRISAAKLRLGTEAFDHHWAAGWQMALSEAASFALDGV